MNISATIGTGHINCILYTVYILHCLFLKKVDSF